MERLTYRTDIGVTIDKNEDCPTCSICWGCDIPPRKCNYIRDALEKLADYEDAEEQGLLLRLKPTETELLIGVMNTYRNNYPLSAVLNEKAYKEFNDLLERLCKSEAEQKLASMQKGE